jgi:site-specific recombinase XerD
MFKGRPQDPGFLFLSQRGSPFDRSSLNKCLLRAASRLLLDRAISGYTFRHSVASHLLADDMDVICIAPEASNGRHQIPSCRRDR